MSTKSAPEAKKGPHGERTYKPQDYSDRSKFMDPVADESYASQKNVLWTSYNAKYAPAFQQFRFAVIAAIEEIAQKGAKSYKANIKRITTARNKYVKIALDAFTEYIESLTKVYVEDKLRTYGVKLATVRARAKGRKQRRTKRGRKV